MLACLLACVRACVRACVHVFILGHLNNNQVVAKQLSMDDDFAWPYLSIHSFMYCCVRTLARVFHQHLAHSYFVYCDLFQVVCDLVLLYKNPISYLIQQLWFTSRCFCLDCNLFCKSWHDPLI